MSQLRIATRSRGSSSDRNNDAGARPRGDAPFIVRSLESPPTSGCITNARRSRALRRPMRRKVASQCSVEPMRRAGSIPATRNVERISTGLEKMVHQSQSTLLAQRANTHWPSRVELQRRAGRAVYSAGADLAGSPFLPSCSSKVFISSACSSSIARMPSSTRRVVGSSVPM